ncbi:MAG TPA: hypothetical protein VGP40_05020, partial [Chthoniobacterales bacterium]|nr:hypothetical protein [Chthoniobacterales bacterium]
MSRTPAAGTSSPVVDNSTDSHRQTIGSLMQTKDVGRYSKLLASSSLISYTQGMRGTKLFSLSAGLFCIAANLACGNENEPSLARIQRILVAKRLVDLTHPFE